MLTQTGPWRLVCVNGLIQVRGRRYGWLADAWWCEALAAAIAGLLVAGQSVAPAVSAAGADATAAGDPLRRVRSRTIGWRVAGLLAGVAAAVALLGAPARLLGLGTALAAPAFALVLLTGVIVGELFGPPAQPA